MEILSWVIQMKHKCHHSCPYKRGRERFDMHKRRQMKVEAEIGVMRPQRNANSNQKL